MLDFEKSLKRSLIVGDVLVHELFDFCSINRKLETVERFEKVHMQLLLCQRTMNFSAKF